MGDPKGTINKQTGGSIAGTHPVVFIDDVVLAPTMTDEQNTLKPAILPIACFRVEDLLFDFDSSFVMPEIEKHIPHLAALRTQHFDKRIGLFPPLSIFGHADPTGTDDYNKALSGRRAQAIYGLITRRVDLWEALYGHALGKDDWKLRGIGTMLTATGSPASDDDVKKAKSDAGVRAALFRAYMDKLCGSFQVRDTDSPDGPSDFLAKGADAKGKGDYQGCSDFNPVLIFSQADQDKFNKDTDKTARNEANASNRRVMVFLFKPGAKVTPAHWPCPRASEGVAGCHKRFWSDGDKRRHRREPDEPRTFDATRDTFACRFYDRMANSSPCERTIKVVTLTIRLMDGDDLPLVNNRYKLQILGATQEEDDMLDGVTDDKGILQQFVPEAAKSAILSIMPKAKPEGDSGQGQSGGSSSSDASDQSGRSDPANSSSSSTAPSGAPAEETPLWSIGLKIGPLPPPDTIAGAQVRLNNLGLSASDKIDLTKTDKVPDPSTVPEQEDSALPEDQRLIARLIRAVKRFQMLYKPHGEDDRLATGKLDSSTADKVKEKHGS
jgi:hypothetical protein